MSDHLPEAVISEPYHLPECSANMACEHDDCCHHCICTALRACEQRVLDDDVLAAAYHGEKGYAMGYAVALNAAEAAVAELKPLLGKAPYDGGYDCCGCSTLDALFVDSLAAIRALKEKP